ncbi:probable cytochrome P450 9f2 [Toxorhynchites rutilus septentrionalis]|uniref:probable cytochrome P450 9f2 n=1 Tax=Toxorhynchites rutilus septentrionalis TaxID=329112 RepID=UPI00247938EC|nr:probable cytochrome P450 9f2 [Toxorhynchites rutilus septentrionalis]
MEVNLLYFAVAVAVIAYIYHLLTRDHDYFLGKPIPSLAAKPLLGNTAALTLRQSSFSDLVKTLYDKFPGVLVHSRRVFGIFDTLTRTFVIRDPYLIKKIAVKDFEYFIDRRAFFGEGDDDNEDLLFSKTLVGLRGQKWRDMRATLSPAFTGSKMRAMFELMVKYIHGMIDILRKEAAAVGFIEHEVKDLYSRVANDIIATCAFGLQVESLQSRENEFYLKAKEMMGFNSIIVFLRMMAIRIFPKITTKLGIDVIGREHIRYFCKIIRDAVRTREAHGIVRPDMIHLLTQARKGLLEHPQEETEITEGFATVNESDATKVASNKKMTEIELIAQCMIFFFAGFDTVSTEMLFMSYELGLNPDVQQKLYEEILETNSQLQGEPLTYDVLQKMKYMDMVVSETLRMWPAPAVDRQCLCDYTLDDGEGLKFTIDEGACVWIPVHGIHRDPMCYPNPTKFDPERFSDTNRVNINMDAYMPFGIGPRNCIGSRFALMEMKVIMYQLLLHFSLERTEQTQVPLQLLKGLLGLGTEKGAHLRLRLRQ